jgi:hypothetical protein
VVGQKALTEWNDEDLSYGELHLSNDRDLDHLEKAERSKRRMGLKMIRSRAVSVIKILKF